MWSYQIYGSAGAMAALMAIRYYTPTRYPFIPLFEAYYVQQLQLSPNYSDIRITWAHPKEPKHFVIPVDRFKQLHHLRHET